MEIRYAHKDLGSAELLVLVISIAKVGAREERAAGTRRRSRCYSGEQGAHGVNNYHWSLWLREVKADT